MMRQRLISTVAAAIVLPLGLGMISSRTASADVHVGVGLGVGIPLSHHSGIGVWLGSPGPFGGYAPYHRFHYGYPYRPVYIAPPPVVVYSQPAPPQVIIPAAPVEPEAVPVTIWVNNSNGSKTAVKLIQHGNSYEGPRGEWYTGMPTNEQLRSVYGF
jgi:hypothetical protein